MNPGRVRMVLHKFMMDISIGSVEVLEEKYGDVLNDLADKLSEKEFSEDEINQYLEDTLDYIAELNKWFKSQRRSCVPYTKVFTFAKKDDRLSEFMFSNNIKKKKRIEDLDNEDIDLAGFDSEIGESEDIIFKNEMYTLIHETKISKFNYSPVTNQIIVKTSKKKIITYSMYASMNASNKKRYLKLSDLYSRCKKKSGNGICDLFCDYYLKTSKKKKKVSK